MIRSLCVLVLVASSAHAQGDLLSGLLQDIVNIVSNLPVSLMDCSNVHVSLSNVHYILHTEKNQPNGSQDSLSEVISGERVIIIVHGWLQSSTSGWVTQMKDVYLSQGSINVILIDWSVYSQALYGSASCAVPPMGIILGELIYQLVQERNVTLDLVQINGFSLGAQISGFAGQEVQTLSGGSKIARINGLDAAGPGYYDADLDKRLDPGDAIFVQAITTSVFGYNQPYATADFHVKHPFFSCGLVQNGCPFNPDVPSNGVTDFSDILSIVFCDHVRAAVYWIESVRSKAFVGRSCKDCLAYDMGLCETRPAAVMGEHCPSDTVGLYFLQTNGESPFAMGE